MTCYVSCETLSPTHSLTTYLHITYLLTYLLMFCLQNDPYCVGWGVKLYSLSHPIYLCTYLLVVAIRQRVDRQAAVAGTLSATVCRHPWPSTPGRTQHSASLADDDRLALGWREELGRTEGQEAEGQPGVGEGCESPAGQLDGLAQTHGRDPVDAEFAVDSREPTDRWTAAPDARRKCCISVVYHIVFILFISLGPDVPHCDVRQG